MDDDKEPRVWVYARVSTDHQEASIPIQLDRCKAYIKMAGLSPDGEPTGIFKDPGVSGGVPISERPAGKELIRRVRAGDHVVTATLDRMFRNSGDCSSTVDKLNRIGVALHITSMNGVAIDTSSAAGKFFVDVMGAVAELDRKSIVDRLHRGRAKAMITRPMRTAKCRIGLKEVWSESGGKRVFKGYAIHEAESRLLATIVRLRRAGRTWYEIAEEARRICRRTPGLRHRSDKFWSYADVNVLYKRVLAQKAGLEDPRTIDGRIAGDPDDPANVE